MAVATGSIIVERDTQVTVISDASAIADGSFNAGTITAITPADELEVGDAVLSVQFLIAPVGDFKLYRRDLNIDGTNDAEQPQAAYRHVIVGAFPLHGVTTRQYIPLTKLELTADQEFYIKNDGGQATTGTTVIKITPRTLNNK